MDTGQTQSASRLVVGFSAEAAYWQFFTLFLERLKAGQHCKLLWFLVEEKLSQPGSFDRFTFI
jgi:hypothetical protein